MWFFTVPHITEKKTTQQLLKTESDHPLELFSRSFCSVCLLAFALLTKLSRRHRPPVAFCLRTYSSSIDLLTTKNLNQFNFIRFACSFILYFTYLVFSLFSNKNNDYDVVFFCILIPWNLSLLFQIILLDY